MAQGTTAGMGYSVRRKAQKCPSCKRRDMHMAIVDGRTLDVCVICAAAARRLTNRVERWERNRIKAKENR